MSLAADTREAVRDRPFLLAALRAGVVNYAAAARTLDVEGDPDAVATALRRFAAELEASGVEARDARVRMQSGLEPAESGAVLSVAGEGFAPGDGPLTGVVASGEVDAGALAHALGALAAHGVAVEAAGVAGGSLAVVVERRDGPDALRLVESALAAVPNPTV